MEVLRYVGRLVVRLYGGWHVGRKVGGQAGRHVGNETRRAVKISQARKGIEYL